MRPFLRALLVCFLLVISSACAPQAAPTQPVASPTPLPGSELPHEGTATPVGEPGGAIVLTVWLPPGFDIAGGNLAANMLQGRLAEFTEQHPQVRIETRVKAEEGTGGLLDSLLAAQAAAPLSQPDLVLLPHVQLQAAAQSAVLHPMAGLTTEQNSEDWYPFAQQMITVEGQAFALPFAADALVVAYRPTAINGVPANWSALLEARRPLGLAVADPWAQFSFVELSALQSSEESTKFSYSQDELTQLFEFYTSAQQRGIFPFWLTQYETYEQSWGAFTEGRTPMVVAWTSKLFDSRNVDISGAPLPTQDGDYFTLIRGWVWAISTPYLERAELVAELAEYLSTPEFIAQWSAAAGMLPPRASSLAAWSPDAKQALASQIVLDAAALPPQATLKLWGQPLADAMVAILKQEQTPQEAMQAVLAAVANP
ncbi:MAG: extracellular solute-binding protein [Chloroflexi bacterium]|nr:extracellular solute-binding protein [Chloroflexota bacterium]